MNFIDFQYYTSPYGELIIGAYEGKLCLCDWKYRKMRTAIDNRITHFLEASFREQKNEVILLTIKQLEEYFRQERTTFDIPLLLAGTHFQQLVWHELLAIQYGETATYLQQAIKLNNKEAIRAVATANGANAISIIVPCHRIIGSNGELVGYAGGLTVKAKLLTLEGVFKQKDKQIALVF